MRCSSVVCLLCLLPATAAGFTEGHLYIADGAVKVFDPATGQQVDTLDDPSVIQPSDLSFSPDGTQLFVTDVAAADVKVFDSAGALVNTFGGAELVGPRGMDIDSAGRIYIADVTGGDVEVFDLAGAHVRTVSDPQVTIPLNLTLSLDEQTLFLGESAFSTGVHMFDIGGADTWLGTYSTTAADVVLVNGLHFASDGSLFVGDGAFAGGSDTVKSYDPAGLYQGVFAAGFTAPYDIHVDSSDTVWVLNTNDFAGDQVFAYLLDGTPVAAFGAAELNQPTGITMYEAAGVVFGLSGTCPGQMNVSVSGLTPNGSFGFVGGSGPGNDAFPAGPCVGVPSGLQGPLSLLGPGLFTADGAGNFSISPSPGPAVCGTWVQVLDLATCTVSAVTQI